MGKGHRKDCIKDQVYDTTGVTHDSQKSQDRRFAVRNLVPYGYCGFALFPLLLSTTVNPGNDTRYTTSSLSPGVRSIIKTPAPQKDRMPASTTIEESTQTHTHTHTHILTQNDYYSC